MSLFGVKIMTHEHVTKGRCVVQFNGKVVWWGTFANMRSECPAQFDTVHVNPSDYDELRKSVPRIPSQSGRGR